MSIQRESNWKTELREYLPRIANVECTLQPAFEHSKRLPAGPFEIRFSAEQAVAYQLASFSVNGLSVFRQLSENVELLWKEGRMIGVSGLVRFGIEYWAAIRFGLKVIQDLENDGDIKKAQNRTVRLTQSGKTPVSLPWGGLTTEKAYSVQAFIENLGAHEPSVQLSYDFLSEASHPNSLQNAYFLMASRGSDNFSNDVFKKHAHKLLNKTTNALEKTAIGIAHDTKEVLDISLPKIPKV